MNAPFAYDRYVARFKLKNPVPLFLIIVTLPLLLGSVCHAELRTWTAVNGKEVEADDELVTMHLALWAEKFSFLSQS